MLSSLVVTQHCIKRTGFSGVYSTSAGIYTQTVCTALLHCYDKGLQKGVLFFLPASNLLRAALLCCKSAAAVSFMLLRCYRYVSGRNTRHLDGRCGYTGKAQVPVPCQGVAACTS